MTDKNFNNQPIKHHDGWLGDMEVTGLVSGRELLKILADRKVIPLKAVRKQCTFLGGSGPTKTYLSEQRCKTLHRDLAGPLASFKAEDVVFVLYFKPLRGDYWQFGPVSFLDLMKKREVITTEIEGLKELLNTSSKELHDKIYAVIGRLRTALDIISDDFVPLF
ncbi:hypothetical protein A3K42_01850 [candidate division WWE3 bacterium RBG_13_37_7]|uniref:Uncharacterized protein n=1 Tax=candidate division WWE3 bacterium RBG_13_37_7 TaxID=1802609 RepID=A0A1F4U0S4_UNCKA|nr:MAG: hypothetical protein A3K42_01850 [candidate division WWE3 bacterium RBG_13_37_7]